MGLLADARITFRMIRGMPRKGAQQDRLEGFYGGQADSYDAFRERLLHGREELVTALRAQLKPGARIAEIGCGTGRNLERFAADLAGYEKVFAVDLCRPLLAKASERVASKGWTNVEVVEADATTWKPDRPLDAVFFSYSLSMIPTWRAVLAQATANLKPGGFIAVVDFTVPSAHPAPPQRRRSWFTRTFWPRWFAHDGVRLTPDLVPELVKVVEPVQFSDLDGRVPWMLGLAAPYVICVGRLKA